MSEEGTRLPRAVLIVAAVVCSATIVSHIFGRATYSILLPAISGDLVDNFTAAGFLGAANFAGYMAGVILVTIISTRVEPIILLRSGLMLAAAALVLLSAAPSFAIFTIGILLIGFAGAGIWITAPIIATTGVPAHRRGAVMGALTSSMGLGLLIVSQGTTFYRKLINDDSAWREIFGVEAAITLIIAAAAFLLIRPGTTARVDTGGKPFTTTALRSIPGWRPLVISYTLFSTIAGAWTQFLGLALKEDAGFGSAHVGNLFSVLAVAGICGPMIFGRLSDRLGRNTTIAAAASLTAGASLLLTIGAEPWSTTAVALFGLGSYSVPVLTATAVRDHLTDRSFSTAFGAMTIVYGAGSMAAAQLGGVLADRTGSFTIVYLLLAATGTLTAIVALTREYSPR